MSAFIAQQYCISHLCKACHLLLVQAHLARLPAPISDYVTDTKSVLDQSLRILQAMTDVSADAGWLDTALVTMMLVQSLMQVTPNSTPTLALAFTPPAPFLPIVITYLSMLHFLLHYSLIEGKSFFDLQVSCYDCVC